MIHGRRGGGWLPKRDADLIALEEWRQRQHALATAAAAAGDQLTLFASDDDDAA